MNVILINIKALCCTARVVCSSDSMTIVIRRSYLNSLGLNWYDLYVDDHRCRPSANSYEVSFSFPVNSCGTSKKVRSEWANKDMIH